MDHGHNPKRRLGMTLQQASESGFRPGIANGPPLPAVNYGLVGKQAPSLLPTPAGKLPHASAVVITWADAEWAARYSKFSARAAPPCRTATGREVLGRAGRNILRTCRRAGLRIGPSGAIPGWCRSVG